VLRARTGGSRPPHPLLYRRRNDPGAYGLQ